MRFIIKLFLALLLIFLATFFIKTDYTSRVVKLDEDLQKFISSFGLRRENLKTVFKQTVYEGRNRYLYIGRAYKIRGDFPQQQFEDNLRTFLKKNSFSSQKEKYGREFKNIRYNIFLKKFKVYTLSLEKETKGKLALVIDDWGYIKNFLLISKKLRYL